MDIDATVSGPTANAYFTLEDADAAMDGFPNGDMWLNLDESKRTRFLLLATRLVDRFKLWPPKQVLGPMEQSLAFPTSKDPHGVIRPQVFNAVLETLDYLAEGKLVSLKKLQAEGVKSSSLLGQNAGFDKDHSQLPGGARSELKKLWKMYSGPVVIAKPVRRMFGHPIQGSLYESNTPRDFSDGQFGPFQDA